MINRSLPTRSKNFCSKGPLSRCPCNSQTSSRQLRGKESSAEEILFKEYALRITLQREGSCSGSSGSHGKCLSRILLFFQCMLGLSGANRWSLLESDSIIGQLELSSGKPRVLISSQEVPKKGASKNFRDGQKLQRGTMRYSFA